MSDFADLTCSAAGSQPVAALSSVTHGVQHDADSGPSGPCNDGSGANRKTPPVSDKPRDWVWQVWRGSRCGLPSRPSAH
ncbi:MAG: hypothetical protein QOF35_1441 [Actinomycetota bacterium]|nr:hypothetical protein [Actinomycetota bacterium]